MSRDGRDRNWLKVCGRNGNRRRARGRFLRRDGRCGHGRDCQWRRTHGLLLDHVENLLQFTRGAVKRRQHRLLGQRLWPAAVDAARAEGALAGIVGPAKGVAAAGDRDGAGRADIGATAATDAAGGIVLDQAAVLAAGALVLVRQGKRHRAPAKVIEDEAEDIHARNLM